ncbi:ROK family protein [Chloroflexota bacterium]
MTRQTDSPVLAVDIGGTKIMAAIISNDGRILAKDIYPTLAGEGVSSVIGRLSAAMDSLLNQSNMEPTQLGAISIAAAGAVDSGRRLITTSPNLPGWSDVPLGDIVQDRHQINTFLVNDASAAALGEHRFGAGKGIDNLILITLGTGIGGGIVINGEMYDGVCGSAGEFGHMIIEINGQECGCGNNGCLEALASGTAVARDAVERISKGGQSSLVKIVKGKIENITAEKVGEAAKNGDSLALDVLSTAGRYLGIGMVSLVNIFNPEMIILGGGMATLGSLLIDPAERLVAEMAFPISAQAVRIVTAQLGNEAGVYGAAAFAFDSIRRSP